MSKSEFVWKDQLLRFAKKNLITFVALAVALISSGVATFFTYNYANESVSYLTSQLMYGVAEDIKNQLNSFLTESIIPTGILKRVIEQNYFNITHANPEGLPVAMDYLYNTFVTSTLYGVFYVDVYGADIGYLAGSSTTAFFMFRNITQQAGIYACDSRGKFNWTNDTPLIVEEGLTEVTDWPPFVEARQTGVAVWSDPFTAAGFDEIIYARVDPLYWAENGELCCGLGLNIAVGAWQNILTSVDITPNARVFVTDENGLLLAESLVKINSSSVETATLPGAVNSTNLLIAGSAQYLLRTYGTFRDIPESNTVHQFDLDGNTEIALTSRLNVADTLHLIVVIVIPQSDVLGTILQARSIAIGLTITAITLGALKYVPFALILRKLRKNTVQEFTP